MKYDENENIAIERLSKSEKYLIHSQEYQLVTDVMTGILSFTSDILVQIVLQLIDGTFLPKNVTNILTLSYSTLFAKTDGISRN